MRKLFEIKSIINWFGIKGLYKLIKIKYRMLNDEDNTEYDIPIKCKCRSIRIRNGSSDWGLLRSFFWEPNIEGRMYDIALDVPPFNIGKVLNVVDAGANIGLFTVKLSRVYPNANFYCIEPENSNYRIMCHNVSNLNAKTYKCGVWKNRNNLRVTTTELSSGTVGYVVEETEDNTEVTGISIGNIIEDNHIEEIDILKMDIEGSEFALFFSDEYKRWISKVKMIIMEIHEDYFKGGCRILLAS